MRFVPALSLLLACQVGRETPSIPWLHGLANPVGSDLSTDEAARRIDSWSQFSDLGSECSIGMYPGIAIEADVAPSAGPETIIASLAHGIVVLDREGVMITETPGYRCEGSADELEALAAGDAFGAKTIAIAATTGGHRENATWVSLFRIDGRRLDPVFSGTVEERRGTTIERGGVFLLPGALIYRHPRGEPRLWIYNPNARAYLQPGQDPDLPHGGPTVSRLSYPPAI